VIFSYSFYNVPLQHPKFMLIIIFIVSVLMVSTVRYEILPNFEFRGSVKNKVKIILLIIVAVLLIIFPQQALFPLIVLYVFSGIATWIYKLISGDLESVEGK